MKNIWFSYHRSVFKGTIQSTSVSLPPSPNKGGKEERKGERMKEQGNGKERKEREKGGKREREGGRMERWEEGRKEGRKTGQVLFCFCTAFNF